MAKNNETLPTLGNNPRTAVIGSVIITVLLFILIPLSQMLSFHKDRTNITLTEMMMPPPPPPPPEPPPPEQEDLEEEDPEMEEEREPPTLEQLELTLSTELNANLSGAFVIPAFQIGANLSDLAFDLEDLDEIPKVITQVRPVYPPSLRRSGSGGRVVVLFIVDESGTVRLPRIENSSDYAFDKPALDAIKKWRFTPGIKDGKKVKTKMRLPISFSVR